MLRIYERNRDSLCSVFMGKESAKRLLTTVEDVMSSANLGSFARTFRDGYKVFILQLGANAHGNFVMISKLVHGGAGRKIRQWLEGFWIPLSKGYCP